MRSYGSVRGAIRDGRPYRVTYTKDSSSNLPPVHQRPKKRSPHEGLEV
jgi:hypothetical protein